MGEQRGGRSGPGGLTFFRDRSGQQRALLASFVAGSEGPTQARSGSVVRVDLSPTLRVAPI